MTETFIREVTGDEMYNLVYQFSSYAFGPSPPFPDAEQRIATLKLRKGAFYYALFKKGSAVAMVGATPLTQNVRGSMLSMGGVFNVITLPQARRKGYSRRLMSHLLKECHERNMIVSCLYPFRESFYEQMGYATFPQPLKITFNPSALLPLLKKNLEGEVTLMLQGDGFDTYREFMFTLQPQVHGLAQFAHSQKMAAQQNNRFWMALAMVDDKVVGVMAYDLKGDSPTKFKMRAVRFYYTTVQGRYLLLDWIARHIDQAEEVELWLPPYEHPNTWLSDIRPRPDTFFFAPMARIIDIAECDGIPAGSGSFTARIIDPLCHWNNGIWQFETFEGELRVSSVSEAECSLNIQGLSALLYGTNDPSDFSIRGWGDPSRETQQVMRMMFPPAQPYLHEIF